jgi:hypothetical protein
MDREGGRHGEEVILKHIVAGPPLHLFIISNTQDKSFKPVTFCRGALALNSIQNLYAFQCGQMRTTRTALPLPTSLLHNAGAVLFILLPANPQLMKAAQAR